MHLAVTVKSPSSSKGKETLPTPAASSLSSGSLTVTEAVPSVHELWKSKVISAQERSPISSVTLGNGCSARSARFPHTFGTIIEYQRPFDSNRISQAGNASSPAQHRFVPTVGVAPRSRKNIHCIRCPDSKVVDVTPRQAATAANRSSASPDQFASPRRARISSRWSTNRACRPS